MPKKVSGSSLYKGLLTGGPTNSFHTQYSKMYKVCKTKDDLLEDPKFLGLYYWCTCDKISLGKMPIRFKGECNAVNHQLRNSKHEWILHIVLKTDIEKKVSVFVIRENTTYLNPHVDQNILMCVVECNELEKNKISVNNKITYGFPKVILSKLVSIANETIYKEKLKKQKQELERKKQKKIERHNNDHCDYLHFIMEN